MQGNGYCRLRYDSSVCQCVTKRHLLRSLGMAGSDSLEQRFKTDFTAVTAETGRRGQRPLGARAQPCLTPVGLCPALL